MSRVKIDGLPLPERPVIGDLVDAVSQETRRPIQVIEANLDQTGFSGLWVETLRESLIVRRPTSSVLDRNAIICHELAHMLLGHLPEIDLSNADVLCSVLAPHIDKNVAMNFLTRHTYTDPQERSAEEAATALLARITEPLGTPADDDPARAQLR